MNPHMGQMPAKGAALNATMFYPEHRMQTAYIALGSNLSSPAGTPEQTLDAAILRLGDFGELRAVSSYYSTEPVGFADQPTFLNAVAALSTAMPPNTLLDHLLEIEQSFGRDRSHGIVNGPRTLDLDLILYSDFVLSTQTLELPHPRMDQRLFVLVPLEEIAPDRIHPKLFKSMTQLLKDRDDSSEDFPHVLRPSKPVQPIPEQSIADEA
jgi:2-amino-4-hydroxy-6-hydroxymethyldihydropteridine diphosphokinase